MYNVVNFNDYNIGNRSAIQLKGVKMENKQKIEAWTEYCPTCYQVSVCQLKPKETSCWLCEAPVMYLKGDLGYELVMSVKMQHSLPPININEILDIETLKGVPRNATTLD